MERDDVVRDDFPTTRKGWDPEAVRAHLQSLAEGLPAQADSVGAAAGRRVEGIVAAAEKTAAEIEADARRRAEEITAEAEGLLDEARAQAERIVAEARDEAGGRVEQAQAAVESLVSQAEELRTRVGSLGDSLAGEVRERVGAESRDEVTEEQAPEPDPEPEVPEPEPKNEPEPQAAEPEPEPELEPDAGAASTEDLIAQLKGGTAAAGGEVPAGESPGPGSSTSAARLVAMNLALEGLNRTQLEERIKSEFGDLEDLEPMIDEVLARAGRA